MANKISTSKQRIAEMMSILDIKQIDIVNKTGIPKSSLSNYLSGKRTPNQEQLSVIADPYGINPAWLMGYDVPMWLDDIPEPVDPALFEVEWRKRGGAAHKMILTAEEEELILEIRTIKNIDKDFVKRMKAYITAIKEMEKNQ